MEDGLRAQVPSSKNTKKLSLNPCFNGRWSARFWIKNWKLRSSESLNPCFNGRWSARADERLAQTA